MIVWTKRFMRANRAPLGAMRTHAIQQYKSVTAWWYQCRNMTGFFCEAFVRGLAFGGQGVRGAWPAV